MIDSTQPPLIEQWKEIEGYSDRYKISNYGRVYSLVRRIFLNPKTNKDGYHEVNLYNGKCKSFKVHRLVAVAFVENPGNKPCINHKNGFKTCNLSYNIEWVTVAENNEHARLNKLAIGSLPGSESPYAKKVKESITGKIFNCIEDAAKHVGIKKNTLTKMLNGGNPNKTTLTYL